MEPIKCVNGTTGAELDALIAETLRMSASDFHKNWVDTENGLACIQYIGGNREITYRISVEPISFILYETLDGASERIIGEYDTPEEAKIAAYEHFTQLLSALEDFNDMEDADPFAGLDDIDEIFSALPGKALVDERRN